jgi:predicted nucleic acid-binding protein
VYLVDTDVLSTRAPTKAVPQRDLRAWMERNSARLYLSVISIAEVEAGIGKSRRAGAMGKAVRLAEWLETVVHLYRDRIIPVDVAVARRAGALTDRARAGGHAPNLADLSIAATAEVYGYTVLTQNVRHFLPLGVRAIDPSTLVPGIEA